MSMSIDVSYFAGTRSLYKYLRNRGALEELDLFRKTDVSEIPKDNIGYVLEVDGKIAGAAMLYDEQDGGWLNELFEIMPEFRGQHLTRPFYEFIKRDIDADFIHGFANSDETRQIWEHLGQVCIDPECREMIDLCDGRTVDQYLKEERKDLWRKQQKDRKKYLDERRKDS